jgi:hypothetical protein
VTRSFNITVNQTANVNWYINGTPVQVNGSVTKAMYTNTSASAGTWIVNATASNANGTVSREWTWNVTAKAIDIKLNIPTYDGSGQAVHPDIYYNANGWNGYYYWMAMTPYPNGDAAYENPSIIVSNDNLKSNTAIKKVFFANSTNKLYWNVNTDFELTKSDLKSTRKKGKNHVDA